LADIASLLRIGLPELIGFSIHLIILAFDLVDILIEFARLLAELFIGLVRIGIAVGMEFPIGFCPILQSSLLGDLFLEEFNALLQLSLLQE
jgi:hypothetical protein